MIFVVPLQTPCIQTPYIVMASSAKVKGKAHQYGRYINVAVVQTDGVETPAMISERARHLVRIVWHSGSCSVGTTERSQSGRAIARAVALCAHLNRLHAAANGGAPISVADIQGADNEEFRRELIEAYGGLGAYLGEAGVEVLQQDDAGVLLRHTTPGGEPIVAVAVTCPSTGREYMLRVPPATRTAREGVAWTFNMTPDAYQPTHQS